MKQAILTIPTPRGLLALALMIAAALAGAPSPASAQVPAPTAEVRAVPAQAEPGQPVNVNLTVVHSGAASENLDADMYIRIPDGWTISNPGMFQSCAASCHLAYNFAPGQSVSLNVEAMPREAGTFTFEASVIWRAGAANGEVRARGAAVSVAEPTAIPAQAPAQGPAQGPVQAPASAPPQVIVTGGGQSGGGRDDGGIGTVQIVGGLIGGGVIGIILLGMFTNALSAILNLVIGKLFGSLRRRGGGGDSA